jgi:hypothetical protein
MAGSIDPMVKEAAKKAAQYEPVYITEHSVPHDFDFPDNFRVDKIPGMLFYQIIDKSAYERRVVTWWRSREAFVEAWKKQFAQLLGAHGALSFEGFQLAHSASDNSRAKRDLVSWITPGKIAAVVAALALFLTSLSTIEDWGYSLLAIPDCTVWTDPETASKPKAVGESFPIQIQVKNRHLRGSSTASIKPRPIGNGLTLADDTDFSFVQIEPGKPEVQEFRFTASHGGQYTISFEGAQKGGYFIPSRNIPPLVKTIDVWDSMDQSPKPKVAKTFDRSAIVSVEVHNAKPTPYGMIFEATLANPQGVDVFPDKRSIKDADDPLRIHDFAVLRWRIPPSTDVLTPQTFRLVLQEGGTKNRNQDEWNEVLKRLTIQADEPVQSNSSRQEK